MKKIILPLILMALIISLTACGNSPQKVTEEIDSVLSKDRITQGDIDKLLELYDSLDSKKQVEVENADRLDAYRGIDVDALNNFADEIAEVTGDNFSKIIEAKDKYDSLSTKEKALIDISSLDKYLELNDKEKAAIAAGKVIMDNLKDPNSIGISSVRVVSDISDVPGYLVAIDYSGTNSYGANKKDSCVQMIEETNGKFENKWAGMSALVALLGNGWDPLDDQVSAKYFLMHQSEAVELDAVKVLYFTIDGY